MTTKRTKTFSRSWVSRLRWARLGLVVAAAVLLGLWVQLQESRDTLDAALAESVALEGALGLREHALIARARTLAICELDLERREVEVAKREAHDPDREFRLGREASERGDQEEAERHFRNVLRGELSQERALYYRDQMGYSHWVRVLARGGGLGDAAKSILKRAEVRDY